MTLSTDQKLLTAESAENPSGPQRTALRLGSIAFLLLAFACVVLVRDVRVLAKEAVPRVQLHAEDLGPRQIEDLTSKSLPRDYALTWQTMEQALEENRPGLLDGYLTGLAKQDLTQRVSSKNNSGLRIRYHGGRQKLAAL